MELENELNLKKFKINSKEEGNDARFLVTCEYMDGDADNFWNDESYFDKEEDAFQYYKFMKCMQEAQSENNRDYDFGFIANYIKDNPDVIEMLDPDFDREEYSEQYNYKNGLKYFIKAYFAEEDHEFCNKVDALDKIENFLRNDNDYIKSERSTDWGNDASLESVSCTYQINNIIYFLED